jgi:hypothetical protein
MKSYDTLSEAVNDLASRGYTHDFKLCQEGIECPKLQIKLHPENFEITEVHRFEGDTDPADGSVVYAIESNKGLKGVLINGYGIYSDSMSDQMVAKLKKHKEPA